MTTPAAGVGIAGADLAFRALGVALVSVAVLQCGAPATALREQSALPPQTTTAPALPTAGDRVEPEERITCTEDVMLLAENREDRGRQQSLLGQVKERHRYELIAIPGVIGLGVGFIHPGGHPTKEIGIIVKVDAKLPPEQVDPEGLIPSSIEGCAVSVSAEAPAPAGRAPSQTSTMSALPMAEDRGEAKERITCVEEPMSDVTGPPDREAVLRRTNLLTGVRARHERELRAIGGVRNFAIGLGGRGLSLEDIGIVVQVEPGLTDEQLELFPSSIEGCPLIVERVPRPVAR